VRVAKATEILNMYWHVAACLLVLDASVPFVSHSTLYDVCIYIYIRNNY